MHYEKPAFSAEYHGEEVLAAYCEDSDWTAHIAVYRPGEWVKILDELHQGKKVQDYLAHKTIFLKSLENSIETLKRSFSL